MNNEVHQSRISIYNASEMDIDWTEEEDERLRVLVILKREKNWDKIANDIGRTPTQCKTRWKSYLSPSIIKVTERRKWVPEEDDKLSRLVRKYGTKNWRIIASHLRGRLPKQCRERWINHLDPTIIKGRLTDSEWKTVLEAHEDIGNRWSEIAKLIPGRTPNQIKNHWHATIRKNSKRKSSDLFLDEERSTDASSDSFADRDLRDQIKHYQTPTKDLTYSIKSMSDPNLKQRNSDTIKRKVTPIAISSPNAESSLIRDKKSCFTPDSFTLKRKKMKVDHQFSKLDALIQVAECMYQFELDKPDQVMSDVESNKSEGLKRRDSIFKFLDDDSLLHKSMGNVTMKGFEKYEGGLSTSLN